MPEIWDDLFIEDERVLDKALSELLTVDNLEMKTEIAQPINLAKLDTVGYVLGKSEMPLCSATITYFIGRMNLYYVSHKRMSRTETIEGLRAISGKPREGEAIA